MKDVVQLLASILSMLDTDVMMSHVRAPSSLIFFEDEHGIRWTYEFGYWMITTGELSGKKKTVGKRTLYAPADSAEYLGKYGHSLAFSLRKTLAMQEKEGSARILGGILQRASGPSIIEKRPLPDITMYYMGRNNTWMSLAEGKWELCHEHPYLRDMCQTEFDGQILACSEKAIASAAIYVDTIAASLQEPLRTTGPLRTGGVSAVNLLADKLDSEFYCDLWIHPKGYKWAYGWNGNRWVRIVKPDAVLFNNFSKVTLSHFYIYYTADSAFDVDVAYAKFLEAYGNIK